jgi:predicted PurR-regulated permease PerM
VYKRLTAMLKRETLAALVSVLLLSLVIILPALGTLTLVANETITLFRAAQETSFLTSPAATTAREFILTQFSFDISEILSTDILPLLERAGVSISKEIGGVISNAFSLAFNFVIMLLTVFYLLRDGKRLGRFLIAASPLKTRDELHLYEVFKAAGKGVFYGNIASALAQGTLGALGFYFAGLPSPALWGVLIAFLGFIPLLGTYIIFIPASLYLFFAERPLAALFFLLYNVLIVSLVDNMVKPAVMGGAMRIHPFLMLVSILGGIQAFGIMGLIYGPLILAIFIAVIHIAIEHTQSA